MFDETRQEMELRALVKRRKEMTHSFSKGHSYFIFDSGNSKGEADYVKPESGKGCIFVYLRKEGRHHMFREKQGGWMRTYTDTQLMGKKIKECLS